jgi:catechol 2,3-dioxygenase-like lactoylglutathione lyase family enzyme
MGMEQRLSLVTLGVTDLPRSRRFYEEGLGWRASGVGASTGEVVFFQLGGIALALWGREALAEDARLPDPGPVGGFSGVALAHNVRSREEVDAVLARARAAGEGDPMGRVHRLLRRSRRPPVGGGLEPALHAARGRQLAATDMTCGARQSIAARG